MTLHDAQELAVKTWGKNAIAEIRPTYSNDVNIFPNVVIGSHCYVAQSKYGIPTNNGRGASFEEAFYESQFHYTNCLSYQATEENPQFACTSDGSRTNYMKWPAGWDSKKAVAA